jgi:hypothetical protein
LGITSSKSLGKFNPDWSQMFAMTAPRGKELNKDEIKLSDSFFEGIGSQNEDSIFDFV